MLKKLKAIVHGKKEDGHRGMLSVVSVTCLGRAAQSSDMFVLSLACGHVYVSDCWRKETAGIWTVSKLIFYLVITNDQESAPKTAAKDNALHHGCSIVSLHTVSDCSCRRWFSWGTDQEWFQRTDSVCDSFQTLFSLWWRQYLKYIFQNVFSVCIYSLQEKENETWRCFKFVLRMTRYEIQQCNLMPLDLTVMANLESLQNMSTKTNSV